MQSLSRRHVTKFSRSPVHDVDIAVVFFHAVWIGQDGLPAFRNGRSSGTFVLRNKSLDVICGFKCSDNALKVWKEISARQQCCRSCLLFRSRCKRSHGIEDLRQILPRSMKYLLELNLHTQSNGHGNPKAQSMSRRSPGGNIAEQQLKSLKANCLWEISQLQVKDRKASHLRLS